MAKNDNRGNRAATPREKASSTIKAAAEWANTTTGRGVLAGVAATVAGLLLSRDKRVRDAATSAGQTIREGATDAAAKVREGATDAATKVRAKINEHRGTEVGDEPAPPFEVPTAGRTDNSAGVIAH